MLNQRSRYGLQASLAFALTGIVLAIPALTLPLVTVDRLRMEQAGLLSTAVEALWEDGMKLLAVWVWLCGILTPILLLVTLVGVIFTTRIERDQSTPRFWDRTAHTLAHWSMPEVYVLAVLVALTKLGTLVNVNVGAGLWCYAGMALMTFLAWRSSHFSLSPAEVERVANSP